jgi:LuxR family maltose regulon positive regulatory protein
VEQLLATKFHIPPARPDIVQRTRLLRKLNDGLANKLTLLSAPAGFGKTTLVNEWVSQFTSSTAEDTQSDVRIAWLSLDEKDNSLVRFLAYFTTSLKRTPGVNSNLGDEALDMLQSPKPPPFEIILTSLLNEIEVISTKIIFVLDDYHLIDIQPIHEALSFLLEHSPPQLHLVIATREDPLIPLARLRARYQMTELRAADLRFTPSETAEFLNQVMGLGLTSEDILALEGRTEGWITGLQLAAVSLQGQTDKSKLIRSFTGSHRFVLDYLVEDVLNHQTRSLQDFLVQTSILKRLSGPLCDVLTGQENGQETLEMLDRGNLFIVPLDGERHWYRYHHLFADLLRQRLHQTQADLLPILHTRASEWYETKGFTEQAIEHSLLTKDFNRAAVLAERAWPEMHMNYQGITWLEWVKPIPNELVQARPVLSTGCGWSLIDIGDLAGADLHLRYAEEWLDSRAKKNNLSDTSSIKNDSLGKKDLRSLSASIANARAYLTQALGDVTATEKYAQRALDLLPEDDYFERGLSAILRGFAYWANGNLDAAHRAISDSISNMQMLDKILFIISFTSYLADVMVAQGRLNEAKKIYTKLLDMVGKRGDPKIKETAVLHLGLSEICYEQGDAQAARNHLQKSEQLGRLPAFPPWYRHWVIAHIRPKQAAGDLAAVFKILNEAERLYYRHPIPDIHPLTALIAHAQLINGNLAEAIQWANERKLSVDDDLSYLREFEHLILARILIAQYRIENDEDLLHGTLKLLDRLLKSAEDDRRKGSVIEILMLKALANEAMGEILPALTSLEHALNMAEPEGYMQVFVDEGPPMARLLYESISRGISSNYVSRLLAAFPILKSDLTNPTDTRKLEIKLLEPLSERELDVLKLIAEGLTNQVIASKLYLSLNTIKVHTRNIYSKLGVNNRTQAVAQARSLGILPFS